MSHFYTPCKRQKMKFSGGTEMKYWLEMAQEATEISMKIVVRKTTTQLF